MSIKNVKSNEAIKELTEATINNLTQLIDQILTTDNELDPYPLQSMLDDLNQMLDCM